MRHTKKGVVLLMMASMVARDSRIPVGFGVDFDVAMSQTPYYYGGKQDAVNWKMVKDRYSRHIIKSFEYKEDSLIPKIIHHIWLGSPLPERCRVLRETWIKHHPDWQFILWTEKDIEQFGLINKDLYLAAKNYAEKSDIARYEILYRMGGLYVDTDFECLCSFDVFHHSCDFYAGVNQGPKVEVFNGLIGSRAQHPILKECLINLGISTQQHSHFSKILFRTGPYFFTQQILYILRQNSADRIILFPLTYFYPWPSINNSTKHVKREEIEQWFRSESFAVHHWHCSWMKAVK